MYESYSLLLHILANTQYYKLFYYFILAILMDGSGHCGFNLNSLRELHCLLYAYQPFIYLLLQSAWASLLLIFIELSFYYSIIGILDSFWIQMQIYIYCEYFSICVAYLFVFLMVSSEEQKWQIFIKFDVTFFLFYLALICSVQHILANIFSQVFFQKLYIFRSLVRAIHDLVSQLFTTGGQSIRVSASVLPVNIQD